MKRILIPSILIATVLVGGILAYSMWISEPEDYFKRGKEFYDKGEYSKANVDFLNVLQKEPLNRDARFLLALSYQNQKNMNAAAQQLVALLEDFPDDVEASLRLGNLYLAFAGGNTDILKLAAEHAAKILAKNPQNVDALILSGNASSGLKEYRSAVEFFEKALTLDPQNTAAYVSLGTTYAVQNNPAAEQAFLKARQVNPKDKSALISLGNYYRAGGKAEKAEGVFKEAISFYPGDKDIYLQVVQFYFQAGRLEEGERILREAQIASPKDPSASLILVGLYEANNRAGEARTLLLDLKKTFPDNIEVAAKLALNVMQTDPARSRAEVDQILKAEPNNLTGQLLLGELQFYAGDYDAVEKTFAANSPVNLAFPQPELFLGQVALKKGQADQAQEHFQKSLAVNGSYLPARIMLADLLLNKGKTAESRAEVRKALAAQPSLPGALLLDATLDLVEKRYSDAEPKLNALVKSLPNDPFVQRQMAMYLEARGRTADAEKSFIRAAELQTDPQKGLQDLVQFYVRNKQADRAVQRINSVPEDKKLAYHYELLGLIYAQSGKFSEAEKAYQKALEKDPSSINTVGHLATLYIQNGHLDQGMKELDVLIQKNPSNASAYTVKGMIAESQGKMEDAKQYYTQALKIDSAYATAGNNLAYLLAEQGKELNIALAWAQMARKNLPDNPGIADTLGWVYYKLGNYLLARSQLQFAVEKQPDSPVFQYHLAMIYKETKQFSEAQSALRKAVNNPKDFKEKSLAQAALKEIASLK